MKVGLLIIATNKYIKFLQPLISSADEFFMNGHEITYFIFSNKEIEVSSDNNIVKIDVEHKEWPWMTLGRYKIFSTNSEELSKMDYLYYCDVDMKFLGVVGDEILSDRVATQHPGYYERRGSPETNPDSLACVYPNEEMQYFAGGFNGGTSIEYLKMSETISKNIDIDYSNGLIAVWHDESHMNRYFIDNKPTKVLNPSYCYGESMDIPFDKKLIALDKDHSEIRSEDVSDIKNPKVSILLPVYNGEKYLKYSIDSVLNQTFTDFELLIGFNGTVDSSKEIVNSYGDDRIRVFDYGMDKGKPKTLNKLLKETKSDLIALQDDDDIWINDKLEKQMVYVGDYDVIGTQILYCNSNGDLIDGHPNLEFSDNNIKSVTKRGNNQIANSSTLIKKSAIESIIGWDENLTALEDFDMWIRMIGLDYKFYNLSERLMIHRRHSDSNFNTLSMVDHNRMMYDILKKNNLI
jgi:histo-blood group ABO system transferase